MKQIFATLWVLYAVLIFLGVVGWIINVVEVITMTGGDVTTEFILRCVGVPVAPLGAIFGWFM